MNTNHKLSDDRPVVLCHRISTHPVPLVAASVKLCTVCRQQIWVSNGTWDELKPQNPQYVCQSCGTAHLSAAEKRGEDVTFGITQDNISALREHLGLGGEI